MSPKEFRSVLKRPAELPFFSPFPLSPQNNLHKQIAQTLLVIFNYLLPFKKRKNAVEKAIYYCKASFSQRFLRA
jgi:hypothetical protein